jgi:hypothetical protein
MLWVGALFVGSVALGGCADETGTSAGSGTTSTGSGGNSAGGNSAGGNSAGGNSAGGNSAGGNNAGGNMCLDFAALCTNTDVCCDFAGETGQCFPFGMGSRCTIPCPADPNECPNNGAGCNNQNPPVCKTN